MPEYITERIVIIRNLLGAAVLGVAIAAAAHGQAAPAASPDVPRTQFIAQMDLEFGKMDADKNGQLSQAEFLKLVTGTPPADGRPLLAKLDTNKDGVISLVEHRAGKLSYFDQIDTDKDGIVSLAEMKAAGVVK